MCSARRPPGRGSPEQLPNKVVCTVLASSSLSDCPPATAYPWPSATSVHQIVPSSLPFQGQLSPVFPLIFLRPLNCSFLRKISCLLARVAPLPLGPISLLSPSPSRPQGANACCCPGLTSQSQGEFAGTEACAGQRGGGGGGGRGGSAVLIAGFCG